jgi:hypothetical protein
MRLQVNHLGFHFVHAPYPVRSFTLSRAAITSQRNIVSIWLISICKGVSSIFFDYIFLDIYPRNQEGGMILLSAVLTPILSENIWLVSIRFQYDALDRFGAVASIIIIVSQLTDNHVTTAHAHD